MFNLLQICVFLSGGVALVLEAVYQKYLATLIGASTPSATIVLVTYFLGITLGSVVCPKKGGSPRLRLSFLELAIALWSLTLALLFYRSYDFLMDALADWSGSAISLAAMRWLIAMIWILPPTMAMGAHLPTLECFLETNGLGKSWQLTRLYALNTIGACFFTFITPFLFFQNLGLEGTLLLSAAIGLIVASLLFFGLKKFQAAAQASPPSEEDAPSPEKAKTTTSLPASAAPGTQTASSSGGTASADIGRASSAAPAPGTGAAKVTGPSVGAASISASTPGADESDQFQPFRGRVPWPILLAFFSGLLIFSLEVIWNHLVSSVMGASTYSFSIILGVVLLSLAIASRRVERLPASGAEHAVEAVTVALRQLTLAIPITMLLWPWSGRLLAVIRTILNLESFWSGEFFKICIAFVLIKPIAAAAGTLFPATFRVLKSGASPSGRDVGRLNVANTLGCVAGALTGNYLFIPAIGAQWTFILLWLVCLAAWRVLLRRRTMSHSFADAASAENNPQAQSQIQHQPGPLQTALPPQTEAPAIASAETMASQVSAEAPDKGTVPGEKEKTTAAADAPDTARAPVPGRAPLWKIRLQRLGEPVLGTLIVLAFIIGGGWNMDEMLAGYGVFLTGQYYSSAKTVFLREDQYAGFVSVRQQELDGVPTTTLLQNGKFDANDTDQTFAQIGFGLIPSMFSRNLDRALVIGFGSGQTASVIYDTGYKEIDICEMSPGHIEAAKKYFFHLNKNVLDRENVHLWLEDGRNYMGRTRHKYDLISIEITSLFFSGSSDLYSREFYRQVSSHLTEYGIFQQWMQLHHLSIKELAAIMATAREVFPYVEVWDNVGQAIIIASNRPLEFQKDRWKHFMESESLASEREHFIGVLGEGDSETFQKNRRFLTREQIDYILQKIPHVIHTDRNKWLEFHAPLYYLAGSELFEKNIQNLIELREESKRLQTPSK